MSEVGDAVSKEAPTEVEKKPDSPRATEKADDASAPATKTPSAAEAESAHTNDKAPAAIEPVAPSTPADHAQPPDSSPPKDGAPAESAHVNEEAKSAEKEKEPAAVPEGDAAASTSSGSPPAAAPVDPVPAAESAKESEPTKTSDADHADAAPAQAPAADHTAEIVEKPAEQPAASPVPPVSPRSAPAIATEPVAAPDSTPKSDGETKAEHSEPAKAEAVAPKTEPAPSSPEKEKPVVTEPAAQTPAVEEKEVPAVVVEVSAEIGVHAKLNNANHTGVTARLSSDDTPQPIDSLVAPISPRQRTPKGGAAANLMGLFVPPEDTKKLTPAPTTATGAAPAPAVSPSGPPPARPPPQLKKAPAATGGTEGKAEKQPAPSPKAKAPNAARKIDPKQRCKICEQEPLTHVFLPCGHKAACETCATDWFKTIGTCRVCLAPAQGVAPLPTSGAASAPTTPSASPAPSPHGSATNVTATTSATSVAASASASASVSAPASGATTPVAGSPQVPKASSTSPATPHAAPAASSNPVSALASVATGAASTAVSAATSLPKKLGALPKYASLRQRGLATFLLETGQEQQLAQVDTIDLSGPKGDEGRSDHKEVDLAQNFEHFSEDTYNIGVKLFNEKPKKGIEYLLEKHVFARDASAVAQWILSAPELDKVKIGEYIGEPDAFNLEVLRAFAGRLDFKNLDFDIALRQMLTHFRLPGEAQKIDRIMNSFAVRYYLQNKSSGVFKSSDAVYVLAFAVIMLNTDLHNPQVKKKMSKEEFLKNNRGINEGENLPSDFLEDLYERIKNDEIKMKSDGGKWAKATKKGWLQMGKNKDSPKKLWFVLTESTLYWFKKMGDPELGSLPVIYFKLEKDKDKAKKLIFYLTQAEKTAKNPLRYTFQAPNEREFNSWLTLLQGPTQTLEV